MQGEKDERWRSVAGFPGYHVSNLGRVRSVKKIDRGIATILSPSRANFQKRALVTLYRDKKPHYRYVAPLVCAAFHGPKSSPEMQAAHEDGDTQNDRWDNLSWKTPMENIADRERHGRTAKGENHYAANLTDADVLIIRKRYAAAKSASPTKRIYGIITKIAKEYGVGVWCIDDIVYGRTFKSAPTGEIHVS